VCLLLIAGPAQAAVVLYVGGSTTTPCLGATGAALGDVTISVSSGGVILDGSYLTITVNPGILTSTPILRAGSLASKGFVTFVDSGNFRFTFASGTGSTTVSVGDYLTFGMTGNAPGYETTVVASVGASDPWIAFINAAVVIASVSAANCAASGHILTSVASLTFGGPPGSSIPSQSFTMSNSARPGQNIFPAVSAAYPAGTPVAWLVPALGVETAGVALVTIGVSTIGLSEGDYTAQIRIDSAYADNSPLYVPVTLRIGMPASLTIVSGDHQTGVVGSTLPLPLVVKVTDAYGNLLSAVAVAFAVTGGGGSVSAASATTGGNGQAQTLVTLGTTATTITITASVTGVDTLATFTLTATPGPAASLVVVLGNNQAAVAGTTLPAPLIVKLTDVYGNAVPGTTVNFEVTGGGGSLSAATATTGANGQAQVTWTLGSIPGPNTARAWMGTLGPVVFQATGLSGGVPVGSVTVENASGSPGGTARIAVMLDLNSGSSVDSLSFGVGVTPNGVAPALTDDLSFVADTGMPPSPLTATGPGPGLISVGWLNLLAALSGTVRLGEVVVPIPALAVEGQTYRVRVTGVSVSLGMVGMAALAGPDMMLSIQAHSYLVGDAFPLGSDLNGDGDKDDAGEFGDGNLGILDLIYALRAVTSVPGYRPPACSDRFDAIDSHPADTPTVRGGNGTLNTVDLIYTLRRVTNVDTSRPRRYSRSIQPCTAGAGEQVVAQAFQPVQVTPASFSAGSSDPAGSLRLGEPREVAVGVWQVPVYLEARGDLDLAGLSFALAIDNQPGVRWVRFVTGEAKAPTLLDADVPGALSVAWLEGLHVAASQRLLLGYVEIAGAEAGRLPASTLQFHGTSASAPDGSDVRLTIEQLREQM
jgi:hypothetical protein